MYSWWSWQSPSLINRERALQWLCGRCDRGWRARMAAGETAIWRWDSIRHHLAHWAGQKVIAKVTNGDVTPQPDKDWLRMQRVWLRPPCCGCSEAISVQNETMQPIGRKVTSDCSERFMSLFGRKIQIFFCISSCFFFGFFSFCLITI